jgi:hypothetical protein
VARGRSGRHNRHAPARARRDSIAPPAQGCQVGRFASAPCHSEPTARNRSRPDRGLRIAERCLTTEVRKTATPFPSAGGSVAPAALGERDSLGCERCCFRRAAGIGVRVEFHRSISIRVLSDRHAAVAQWKRAPGYEPGGREFESLRRLEARILTFVAMPRTSALRLPST